MLLLLLPKRKLLLLKPTLLPLRPLKAKRLLSSLSFLKGKTDTDLFNFEDFRRVIPAGVTLFYFCPIIPNPSAFGHLP
jgi:hypothetical protein